MLQSILSAKLVLFPVAAIGVGSVMIGGDIPRPVDEAPSESLALQHVVSEEPSLQEEEGQLAHERQDEMHELLRSLQERVEKLEARQEPTRRIVVLGNPGAPSQEPVRETIPEETSCTLEPSSLVPERKVVFNEIAWAGTPESSSQEWMELKNISGRSVSLEGWQLFDGKGRIHVTFQEEDRAAEEDTFLLVRGEKSSVTPDRSYRGALRNGGETLYLFDEECQLQDAVFADREWPAGDNGTKRTMARTGDLAWRTSSQPGGTPGKENNEKRGEPKEESPEMSLSFVDIIPSSGEFRIMASFSGFEKTSYDVKLAFEKEGRTLSRTWDWGKGAWRSSQFYIREAFSGPSSRIGLKVSLPNKLTGEAELVVRARESGTSSYEEERYLVLLALEGEKSEEKEEVREEDTPLEEESSEEEQAEESEEKISSCEVNVNEASHEDLQKLHGIGPTLAQRIIEEREGEGGPFSDLEDLQRVSGIGPKTVEGIQEQGIACAES